MKTVADAIREMDDLTLAYFLGGMMSERDHVLLGKLAEQGVRCDLVENPALSIMNHMNFLRKPASILFHDADEEEEADNECPGSD